MNVKLYAYSFYSTKISKEYQALDDFENDFCEFLRWLISKSAVERNEDLHDISQMIYIDNLEYDPDQHLVLMEFMSAEYNKVRKVIDTKTLEEKPGKQKKKNEGDEESTSLLMKFESTKEAVGIFQYNRNGVSIAKVMAYLNTKLREYHREVVGDRVLYAIHYNNMVSEDFLKAINETKRIRALTLMVDSKEIGSDFLGISELGDVREEMQIVLKPYRGSTIRTDTVENYYHQLRRNDNNLKRITVNVDKMDGSPVSFDTEKIKKTYIIEVNEVGNGVPDAMDLHSGMQRKLNLLCEEINE